MDCRAAADDGATDEWDLSVTVAGLDGAVIATVVRRLELRPDGPDGASSLLVVDIAGDLDLATDPLVRAVLTHGVQSHPQVCCDLSGATSVCAAGVNTLLSASRHAAAAGHRFTLRGARGLVRMIFAVTGLDLVMTLHE